MGSEETHRGAVLKLKHEGKKTRGCGRQYTITRKKKKKEKIASVCDFAKAAESSLENKSDENKKEERGKTKHEINKNEATLEERIVLTFFFLGY